MVAVEAKVVDEVVVVVVVGVEVVVEVVEDEDVGDDHADGGGEAVHHDLEEGRHTEVGGHEVIEQSPQERAMAPH